MTGSTHKMPLLNPDDFVITRRRKKYRFAHFANAENCYELAEWNPLTTGRLVVEIGAGTGLFLTELAKRHPEKCFIALDVKADRLQKGARVALEAGLTNIFFVRARADQLGEVVAPGSVSELWLTFSDPFPKKRDAKRRLTHEKFLEIYKKSLMSKNAQLLLKTDDTHLFQWSLEQLVATDWCVDELSFDLHSSSLSAEYKLMTSYEARWHAEGRTIGFVRASPGPTRRSNQHP